jgi:hypothetical protein
MNTTIPVSIAPYIIINYLIVKGCSGWWETYQPLEGVVDLDNWIMVNVNISVEDWQYPPCIHDIGSIFITPARTDAAPATKPEAAP